MLKCVDPRNFAVLTKWNIAFLRVNWFVFIFKKSVKAQFALCLFLYIGAREICLVNSRRFRLLFFQPFIRVESLYRWFLCRSLAIIQRIDLFILSLILLCVIAMMLIVVVLLLRSFHALVVSYTVVDRHLPETYLGFVQ
jgi:hypothetical protein